MDKINQDSRRFKQYLESLSVREHREIIKRIAIGCMVKDFTVRNWKAGLQRIAPLYKAKIEEITGQKIFEDEDLHGIIQGQSTEVCGHP